MLRCRYQSRWCRLLTRQSGLVEKYNAALWILLLNTTPSTLNMTAPRSFETSETIHQIDLDLLVRLGWCDEANVYGNFCELFFANAPKPGHGLGFTSDSIRPDSAAGGCSIQHGGEGTSTPEAQSSVRRLLRRTVYNHGSLFCKRLLRGQRFQNDVNTRVVSLN